MSSFTKRHEAKKRAEVVGALRNLATRISKGELDVTNFGFWRAAVDDSYSMKLDVKVSDKFKENTNS